MERIWHGTYRGYSWLELRAFAYLGSVIERNSVEQAARRSEIT